MIKWSDGLKIHATTLFMEKKQVRIVTKLFRKKLFMEKKQVRIVHSHMLVRKKKWKSLIKFDFGTYRKFMPINYQKQLHS